MPIAASVMGVAAVGWVAITLNSDGPAAERIAAAKVQQPVALVSAPADTAARATGATAESSEREYLFAHQAMAVVEGLGALLQRPLHRLRLPPQIAGQRVDGVGSQRRALRQLADLIGHDTEAAPLLAGPGGLDGSVQGE